MGIKEVGMWWGVYSKRGINDRKLKKKNQSKLQSGTKKRNENSAQNRF